MTATRETPWGTPCCRPVYPTASRSETHRRDARADSLAYLLLTLQGARCSPLCGRIGWVRGPACYANGARRMNGMGEVGARVRVDKLKPWNYSLKPPFPPNPRWRAGVAGAARNRGQSLAGAGSEAGRQNLHGANRDSAGEFGAAVRSATARLAQASCSARTSRRPSCLRLGNTYQIALNTCSATRIPHAVRCAAGG